MASALINQSKACSKCGEVKDLNQFYAQRGKSDGRRADCADCSRARRRKYYSANRDIERERHKGWLARNADYPREWMLANQCEIKWKAAERYRANKDRYNENTRRWRAENVDRARAISREAYYKQRNSANFRVAHAVRANVWRALRTRKGGKPTFELLGYTLADLVAHLELQFTKGMDWSNYGQWHIDHIIPLSSFDYQGTDCPGFRAAWALTNLRPMWGRENLSKGAKVLTLL